jgi:hypothetical protein
MVMSINIMVFWIVTPCSLILKYLCSRGTCCLHLQEGDGRWRQQVISKCWYLSAELHSITFQKTVMLTLLPVLQGKVAYGTC